MTIALSQSQAKSRGIQSAWSLLDVAKLVFALVSAQAIFWSFVVGAVHFSPLNQVNLDRYRVLTVETAQAKSVDDLSPIGPFAGMPSRLVLFPNPGILRFDVVVKDPTLGIGIFIPRLADNAVLMVNGARLSPPDGAFSDNPDRTGVVGLFYEIPSQLLVQGTNTFNLAVVRACCRAFVNAVYAGPLPQMRPIGEFARWFRVELAWIIIATSALVGMIATSLLSLERNRPLIWSVVACSATVALGTYFYLDSGSLIPTIWRTWYGHVLGAIIGYLSFLSLVNAWTDGPKWVYRVIIIVSVVTIGTTALAVPFVGYEQALNFERLFLVVIMAAAILGVWALLFAYVQTRETARYWQAGLLLISSVAAIIDYVYALQLRVQPIYFVPFSNLTLMAAIGFALAQRGARLYLEAEAANLTLAQRIETKEQELVVAAAALRAQEAQTAIEAERARIMRDMHDGMGGQLLSLLVQTRDETTSRNELEQSVEAAIGDLRLLIDSLDSVGDSLDVALAVFRDRLAPRLRSLGVTIEWHNKLLKPTSGHTPSTILNVYRILQEAMANAVRHSGATKIIFTVAPSATTDMIDIIVQDNGKGFAQDATMGRGLANMRRRAEEIGGTLKVDSSANGTQICLILMA